MDHARSSLLLGDLVWGRLARDESLSAWTHVATCTECQDVLATMHQVRHALTDANRRLAGHPDPEDIVRLALDAGAMPPDEGSRLDEHLRECTSCRREVELTRATSRAGHGTRTGVFERLRPILAPAAAAVMILLAYPAYLGVTELPALRSARDRSAAESAGLRARERELEQRLAARDPQPAAAWAGAVPLLYLRSAVRGASGSPELRLRPGQPYQPILVELDLGETLRRDPGARVEVLLRRAGENVWQVERAAAELWDAPQRIVSLLVPVSLLATGPYRIELRSLPDRTPRFDGRFSVSAGQTGAPPTFR